MRLTLLACLTVERTGRDLMPVLRAKTWDPIARAFALVPWDASWPLNASIEVDLPFLTSSGGKPLVILDPERHRQQQETSAFERGSKSEAWPVARKSPAPIWRRLAEKPRHRSRRSRRRVDC